VTGWWAAAFVAQWVLVIALCIVVLALARQVGTLHLRLGPRGPLELAEEGPPLGEAPMPAESVTMQGDTRVVGGPGDGQFLLFVSPTCPICDTVLPSLPAVASVGRIEPIVIADVERRGARKALQDKRIDAPVIADPALVELYGVPGVPYAVVLDERGVVLAKGTVNNLEQMESMVDMATARRLGDDLVEERIG
jgi:methylamine dehydrogenase accessory protein MauD